jgi:hypothetical protein
MIIQEIKDIFNHKPRISYFLKWWNIVTTIMLTLFVMAALSWIVGFAITGGWSAVNYSLSQFAESKDGYELLLLGNSFFSLAIVVSIFHLIDLCQVKLQQFGLFNFAKQRFRNNISQCSLRKRRLRNNASWFAHFWESWLGNSIS